MTDTSLPVPAAPTTVWPVNQSVQRPGGNHTVRDAVVPAVVIGAASRESPSIHCEVAASASFEVGQPNTISRANGMPVWTAS